MKFAALILGCCLFTLGVQAQTIRKSADKEPAWKMRRFSAAYAGENLIRPGMQFSADFIPAKGRRSELLLAPVLTFFVFRPFYTSVLLGGRAMYHIHFPSGITLRAIGLSAAYKHKFLLAPVYEYKNGSVERINDFGYGNFHLLAASGLAYNFSDRGTLPLSVFSDFGVSAEPYFGVFKFHYELYVGLSYHFN